MNRNKKQMLSEIRVQSLNNFLNNTFHDLHLTNKVNNNHLQIINESLTHSSACQTINYEKLEFMGDAVLRLIASQYIERNFPQMSVGERSELRSNIVSDHWLATVGEKISIKEVLIVSKKTSQDIHANRTLQAEATEALIGALYECFKELRFIENWLTPFWEEETKKILEDPHKHNYKSALQEWSQGKGLRLPKYETIELIEEHGHPQRFFCKVHIKDQPISKGWGGSRKEAEKEAAKSALLHISNSHF